MNIDCAMRLAALRERLYRCVEDELREDSGHKSYEGAMDVTLSFPSIFSRSEPPVWTITWHCYVVPESGRHFHWKGTTLAEAVAVAEAAAEKIAFGYEMKRFERDMGGCEDEPGEADGSVTSYGPSKHEKDDRPF
jgi:hypothetical protein